MNNSRILFFFLIGFALTIISCKESNSSAKDAARNSLEVPEDVAPVTPAIQSTAGAVAHYICPNNCEGSGGAGQGTCPVCGTAYVHNQAFHSQPGGTTATPGTPATPPTPPAAQNAAGVYHYTCSNGCAGGSGTQGNCATCGNALVHNTAFHN